ncbi:helix-turn-helix transcriptional regulator [Cesiribacter sp. SM1]|uniref:helix-turn-helix transcriptional regulator n=1 Tax=Cesiribacter sp. SM1 TaxID=2861196 RepID=UPI001CD42A48|nr:helix-turn-helix transcriptional regulator [Cesiribacter sp. SM1]
MSQFLNYIDFVQKTIAEYNGLASDTAGYPLISEASRLLLKATNSYSYMVDYRTGGYIFFSSTFSDVVNHSAHLVKKEGIRYYTSLINKQDWEIINNSIFKSICSFLAEAPSKPDVKHRFIFNYRIQQPNGNTLSIRQINNFHKIDKNGRPLINAGVCTVIPYPSPNYKITYLAQSLNSNHIWENEDVKTFAPDQAEANQQLSPAELNILHWIRNGYSSEKIAEKLNRSLHTIKTHRKNMLEKTQSRNTAELLQFSLANGLC